MNETKLLEFILKATALLVCTILVFPMLILIIESVLSSNNKESMLGRLTTME